MMSIHHRLHNLARTIGSPIFVGFSMALSIYVVQAVMTQFGFTQAFAQFAAYDELNQDAMRILDIERDVIALQHGVLAYTQTGYEGVINRVRRLQKQLREELNDVRQALDQPALLHLWARMDEHLTHYTAHFAAVIEERQAQDALLAHYRTLGAHANADFQKLTTIALDARSDPALALRIAMLREQLLRIDLNISRYLDQPDTALVRATEQLLDDFQQAADQLTAWPGDPRRQLLAGYIAGLAPEYRQAFAGVVRTQRGYMNLVNVVMAGVAAEFAWLAAELRQRTLERLAQMRVRMQTDVEQVRALSLWVSILATGLAWLLTGFIASRFNRKTRELAEANRYQSEFLANMSHELRTPLNSILILSRLLAANDQGNLHADQVESAEVIHASGADLLNLINDVLDFSKIEAGRMDVTPETGRLTDFMRQLERQFRPVAAHRGLQLRIELEDRLPGRLTTDWQKLQQILTNLLANACKFTERGSVTLRVFRPSPRDPGLRRTAELTLAFAVIDTGIGIPVDKRDAIFEAFRQVDGAARRKYGGTGLGLTICQRLAGLLGGVIHLDSRDGVGSTFTLYLPLDRYLETGPAVRTGEREPSPGVPTGPDATLPARPATTLRIPRALIVDDDLRNIFSLTRLLKPWVDNILVAQNGRKALECLDQHPEVNLVLMDIMMPEMDGYQAIEAIRAQPRFARLPILVMTAKTSSADRERCLSSGANGFLAKPAEPDELLAALQELLDADDGRIAG